MQLLSLDEGQLSGDLFWTSEETGQGSKLDGAASTMLGLPTHGPPRPMTSHLFVEADSI